MSINYPRRAMSMQPVLAAKEIAGYRERGWVLSKPLSRDDIERLVEWVSEVQQWHDDGDWMNHYEMIAGSPRKCRTEYFTPFHEGLRSLLNGEKIKGAAESLLGEPVALYKEKINYKLAGGAGWEPHQDAPAYPFIDAHVSCMIAVDAASPENGCLEVVSGMHHELIPTDARGCIPPEVVRTLSWETIPMESGDVLWFHSRTPHRSGDNPSPHDRRAVYPTFNALREGDLRETYYTTKRRELLRTSVTGERVRISLIDDFRGIPVPHDE